MSNSLSTGSSFIRFHSNAFNQKSQTSPALKKALNNSESYQRSQTESSGSGYAELKDVRTRLTKIDKFLLRVAGKLGEETFIPHEESDPFSLNNSSGEGLAEKFTEFQKVIKQHKNGLSSDEVKGGANLSSDDKKAELMNLCAEIRTLIPVLTKEIKSINQQIKALPSANLHSNKLIAFMENILRFIKKLFVAENESLLKYTDHLEKSLKEINEYITATGFIISSKFGVQKATVDELIIHIPDDIRGLIEKNSINEKSIEKFQQNSKEAFAKLSGYLEEFKTIKTLEGENSRHIKKAILGGLACAALGAFLGGFIAIVGFSAPFTIPIFLAAATAIALGVAVYQVIKAVQTYTKRLETEKKLKAVKESVGQESQVVVEGLPDDPINELPENGGECQAGEKLLHAVRAFNETVVDEMLHDLDHQHGGPKWRETITFKRVQLEQKKTGEGTSVAAVGDSPASFWTSTIKRTHLTAQQHYHQGVIGSEPLYIDGADKSLSRDE